MLTTENPESPPLKVLAVAIHQRDLETLYAYYQHQGPHVLLKFFDDLEDIPEDTLAVFEQLVAKGAVLKAVVDALGNTLLHVVAVKKVIDKEVIAYLVQQGCSVHAQNKSGETPIQWALDKAHWYTACLYFEKEHCVTVAEKEHNRRYLEKRFSFDFTFLHLAVNLRLNDFVKVLLARAPALKFSINAAGETPLRLAAKNLGKNYEQNIVLVDIIEQLLAAGSELNREIVSFYNHKPKPVWVPLLVFVALYFPERLEKIVRVCQEAQSGVSLISLINRGFAGHDLKIIETVTSRTYACLRRMGEQEDRSWYIKGYTGDTKVVLPRLFQGYTILEQIAFLELVTKCSSSYFAAYTAFLSRDTMFSALVRTAFRRWLGSAKTAFKGSDYLALEEALKTVNLSKVVCQNILDGLNVPLRRRMMRGSAYEPMPELISNAVNAPELFLSRTVHKALSGDKDIEQKRWFLDLRAEDKTKVRNFINEVVLLDKRAAVIFDCVENCTEVGVGVPSPGVARVFKPFAS